MRFPHFPDTFVSKKVLPFVCCVLIVALLCFHRPISNAWHAATTRQQQLVQLYFQNPGDLPVQVKAGQPVTFSFDIISSQPNTIPYIITQSNGTSNIALASGSVQASTIPTVLARTFIMPNLPADSAKISYIITLPIQQETIHFQIKEMQ